MVKITPPKLPFGKLDIGETFGRKLKIEGVPSDAQPLWKWANNVSLAKLVFTPLGNGVWEATLTIDANQDTIGEHRRTLVIYFNDQRLEIPVTYEIVDGIDYEPMVSQPQPVQATPVPFDPRPAPRPTAPAVVRTLPTPTPQPVARATPAVSSRPTAAARARQARRNESDGAGPIAAAILGILLLFVFAALFALRPVIDTAFNSLATQFAGEPNPSPTATVAPTSNLGAGSVSMQICTDAPVSRVYKGVRGHISNIGEGITINLFNGPSIYSGISASVSAGTGYHITEGPVCADGYTWWYVQLQTDPALEGWIVEADNQFNYLSQ